MTSNHIILCRSNNSPRKNDATGAFIPEAKALERLLYERYPDDIVAARGVDLSSTRGMKREPKAEAQHEIARDELDWCVENVRARARLQTPEIRSLSYFCHGWRKRPEFELHGLHGAHNCADKLARYGVKVFNIFACSTAKPHPDGNFAAWTAQACADRGHSVQVLAHETRGHTTWNARLSVYWPTPSASGHVVTHQSALSPDENRLLEPGASFSAFADYMRENQHYRLLLPFLLVE